MDDFLLCLEHQPELQGKIQVFLCHVLIQRVYHPRVHQQLHKILFYLQNLNRLHHEAVVRVASNDRSDCFGVLSRDQYHQLVVSAGYEELH